MPRGGEGRADGARGDLERVRDRRVVQIGVVVEEEHLPLALGEQVEGESELRRARFHARGCSHAASASPTRVACRVDDDLPDPGLEIPVAAEAPALAQRLREPVLHRVAPRLFVACDRGRDPREFRKPFPVQRFELVDHHLYDVRGARFL